MKTKKYLLLVLLVFALFAGAGCTKDDISFEGKIKVESIHAGFGSFSIYSAAASKDDNIPIYTGTSNKMESPWNIGNYVIKFHWAKNPYYSGIEGFQIRQNRTTVITQDEKGYVTVSYE